MTLVTVALVGLLLASRGDDLAGALARLGAPTAAERAAAERELVRALDGASPEALARAVRDDEAEPRRRLARALAARDAHLALTLDLLGGPLDDVARQALSGQVARWCAEPHERPKQGGSLARDVEALASPASHRVFAVRDGASARGALAGLWRHATAPLALALDPALAGEPRVAGARTASWFPLAADLAATFEGAVLVGYGVDPFAAYEDRHGWLAVVPRAAADRAAGDCLEAWCLAATDADVVQRARGLSALAATGWPAAFGWIERRAAAGDVLAHGVLLEAAARGAVSTTLATAASVERLLAELDAQLDTQLAGERSRAHRRLDALLALPPVAPDGSAHAERALAAFETLPPASRWARWTLLAAWGTGGAAADRVTELARAALTGDAVDRALVVPALEALAARRAGSARPTLVLGEAAARHALAGADVERLALLAEARVDPPVGFGADEPRPELVVGWLVGRGRTEAAAVLADRMLTAGTSADLFDALEPWILVAERSGVRGFLTRLAGLRDADDPALARLRFLAEELSAPQAGAYLRDLRLPEPGQGLEGADLPLVAAVATRARGGKAARALACLRAELALRAGDPEAREAPASVLRALDRVVDGYTARGRDVELDPLLDFLEELVRAAPAPWVRALRGRWPLPPRVRPVTLDRADARWEG